MIPDYSNKKSSYFSNARKDIANLIPLSVDNVLEIGCGTGETLAWIRSQHLCKNIIGIEYDAKSSAQAKINCDRFYEGMVEEHIYSFDSEYFDLILCLDVLEHLIDPWVVMGQVWRIMKPGSTFICSIPNVRHVSVLAPLIFNNQWKYLNSGIMDSTHLRFYTTKSASELMLDSGFEIITIERKMPPIKSLSGILNLVSLNSAKDFVCPQFLIKAVKPI